jgi:hypothetical protein
MDMRSMRALTASATLVVALLAPAAAQACSSPAQSDRARLAGADSVVIGTVVSTRTVPLLKGSSKLRKVARMRVRAAFKRNPGRLIDVTFGTPQSPPGGPYTAFDSCDFDLFSGVTYGLFLHRRAGAWRVDGSDVDTSDVVSDIAGRLLGNADDG